MSSIQSPGKATPSHMTSLSALWMETTPPSPAKKLCTRPWPGLCYKEPSKDLTLACLPTARRVLVNHTRECFWSFCQFICLPS